MDPRKTGVGTHALRPLKLDREFYRNRPRYQAWQGKSGLFQALKGGFRFSTPAKRAAKGRGRRGPVEFARQR